MTLNLLDWDEDLQTDSAEEYQALLNGLRRSQGFGLYFVQCSPFSGGKLIERLQADLTDKKIAILKFEKPIADGNIFKRVQTFLAEHNPVETLIIQGLENSLFDAEETKKRLGWSDEKTNAYTWREVPPVLINLNQQRERFRDSFPICFVFLLPQYAIKYLIHRAPDFFDWRSGFINYASDSDTLAQESERIIEDADYDAYCTWSEDERKFRLFAIQTLIDEPKITTETRASLFFEQGLLFAAAQNHLAEMICFDKALAIKPDDHYALNGKGNALSDLGQYEAAIAALDQALSIKSDYPEALFNKGLALFNLGQHETAIVVFDQALAIKPDKHDALTAKGLALFNLGRHEAAIAAYNQALAIKPDYYYAIYNKGIALRNLGQYETAIAAFDQTLSIKPDDHDALNNKGFALGNLGQYEAAIAAYDQALAIKPDLHEALANKGNALGNLGQYELAIAAYDQALAIKPDDHEALYGKGYALDELGQYEAAIAAYDQALAIQPDDHDALDNKGLALANLGQYEAAIAAYDQALALKPDDPHPRYNKACCYGLQGNVENAIDYLQKAIDLDPKYRAMAKTDTDFDPIRHDARFRALVEGEPLG